MKPPFTDVGQPAEQDGDPRERETSKVSPMITLLSARKYFLDCSTGKGETQAEHNGLLD